jgi:hypothetical protein
VRAAAQRPRLNLTFSHTWVVCAQWLWEAQPSSRSTTTHTAQLFSAMCGHCGKPRKRIMPCLEMRMAVCARLNAAAPSLVIALPLSLSLTHTHSLNRGALVNVTHLLGLALLCVDDGDTLVLVLTAIGLRLVLLLRHGYDHTTSHAHPTFDTKPHHPRAQTVGHFKNDDDFHGRWNRKPSSMTQHLCPLVPPCQPPSHSRVSWSTATSWQGGTFTVAPQR